MRAQEASGGAKEAFETAADDSSGWQAIRSGFKAEGRETEPDPGLASEQGDDELPADARMNAEARGVDAPEQDVA
jgi:hypothetical protein